MVLDGIDRDDYDQALKAAQAWLSQMSAAGGSSVKRGTVLDALNAYVAERKAQGRVAMAKEAEGRFKTTVKGDPLASVPLESLTKETFRQWRKRLAKGSRTPRTPRSVNRIVRAVVAGLNHAVKELSHVGNPAAWELEALPDDKDAGGEATAVFLDGARRKAIIGAAEPHAADFFQALEYTGARPKELAAALVGDFNGDTLKLSHRKGRGSALRHRHVALLKTHRDFFAKLARDRPASAPLLTEDGTQPWRRHKWARAFNAAVTAAEVPDEGSAYSFRHARISELLQINGVDPLTVAAQTGTSVAMIERTYLKFIPSEMVKKMELAGLKVKP
jgi:integrase